MRHRHRSGPRGKWKGSTVQAAHIWEDLPPHDALRRGLEQAVKGESRVLLWPTAPDDLSVLKLPELRALAKERGLNLHGARTKAQVIRVLEGDHGGV